MLRLITAALLTSSSVALIPPGGATALQNRPSSSALSSAVGIPADWIKDTDVARVNAVVPSVTPQTPVQTPAVSTNNRALEKSLASTLLFIALDMMFRRVMTGCAFPSSLAGCGVLFVTMLASPVDVSPVLKPGATIMAKWLQVFLVPSLVTLPLAPGLGSAMEGAKVATIIVSGFVISLLSTAYSVLGVRKLSGRKASAEEASTSGIIADAPATPAPKAFTDTTMRRVRTLMAVSGATALACSKSSTFATPTSSAFLLFATIHNFVFGARFPKKLTKVVHPLVTCTTLTWVAAKLLGLATGRSFLSVIQAYKTRSLAFSSAGAGDLLMFMLGPAIFSLGVSMYDRRKLMKENVVEVATSIAVSSLGGLFGTAAMVRLLNLPSVGLSLLSRNVTSALAVIMAGIIGSDVCLTVSMAILTGLLGANFGAALLDLVNIKDPVARGLAIGGATHGLGAAANAHDKDVFPFAAIAMTMVAASSAALVSIPVVKTALVKVALGA